MRPSKILPSIIFILGATMATFTLASENHSISSSIRIALLTGNLLGFVWSIALLFIPHDRP